MTDEPRRWQAITLPSDYPAPAGAYSPAVRAGDLLFVSGQVPRDPRTGQVEGADVVAQSRRVLENLRLVLEAGGARLNDVISVTVYLADENDWATFNEVYRAAFRPPYPTRTVVGAQLRGVLVEVSAIARVPS
jgi:2-iminobutanoate/2-iminopropanoate deaminase